MVKCTLSGLAFCLDFDMPLMRSSSRSARQQQQRFAEWNVLRPALPTIFECELVSTTQHLKNGRFTMSGAHRPKATRGALARLNADAVLSSVCASAALMHKWEEL
jgi:hypothetical protein